MNKFGQRSLLWVAVMMTSLGGARAQDFYQTRLKDGESAYDAKKYVDAQDQLRIAAFGFLDRPPLLSRSLVYLALTQNAAGKADDVDTTLGRFLEVERQFAPFAELKLSPPIRSEFETLLSRRVSYATLVGIPGLAPVVQLEAQRLARLPAAERQKLLEANARREPSNPYWAVALAREAAARSDTKVVIEWSTRALDLESSNVEARVLRARARAARGDCREALADIAALDAAQRGPVAGDQFVCLVETKDFAQAEAVWAKVTPEEKTRAEVARAEKKLAAARPPR